MQRRFLLICAAMLLALPLTSDERRPELSGSIEIYRDARAALLGRAPDRSRLLSVPVERMRAAPSYPLSVPVETAVLIDAAVVEFLDLLTADGGSGSAGEISAERLEDGGYRISLPRFGIENSYRFDRPGEALRRVIADHYENIYWEEEVTAAYASNFSVTVLAAEDLTPPAGEADFADAMLAATLIGARSQPLWGIRDGLGLLDGLGYSLIESGNAAVEANGSYREPVTNRQLIQDIVIRLRRSGESTPEAIRTLINSMVQYEEDDRFLLPEELLFDGEGDCLELALAYYDLLRRSGFRARVLAVEVNEEDPEAPGCGWVTVFQREEFGPYGYLSFDSWGAAESRTWEEIPARMMRDNVFFYPIDPEEALRNRGVMLPDIQAWSLSIY